MTPDQRKRVADVIDDLLAECERAEAENVRLRAECEILAWNLGGCSTYALGYDLDSEPAADRARPALFDVRNLAREAAAARRELREERKDWARRFTLNDVTPWEWMTRAERAEAEVARLRAVLDDASNRLAPCLADPLVRSAHAAMRAALAEPLATERGEPWAEYNREPEREEGATE